MEAQDLEKINSLFNVISKQADIDKSCFYAKDPYEEKYKFLMNKVESTWLKHLSHSKAFIEYSNDLDDIYKNIEECNPNKKRRILTVFDNIIADILNNKKINPIVTELFIRGRKLNISLVFITQSHFAVSKNIRLNHTHYFVIKILNNQRLQQVAFNHSSDINVQDFMNLFKKMYCKTILILVIDAALASDNPLSFKKNLLERV